MICGAGCYAESARQLRVQLQSRWACASDYGHNLRRERLMVRRFVHSSEDIDEDGFGSPAAWAKTPRAGWAMWGRGRRGAVRQVRARALGVRSLSSRSSHDSPDRGLPEPVLRLDVASGDQHSHGPDRGARARFPGDVLEPATVNGGYACLGATRILKISPYRGGGRPALSLEYGVDVPRMPAGGEHRP